MVGTKKNIPGTLLLLSVGLQILLPVVMCLAILAVRQMQHMEIAAAKTSTRHFEHIQLSATEVTKQYKAGDEISYKGELYDISEVISENGAYTLTVLADKPENKLQQLTAELSGQTTTAAPDEISVLPFFLLYYEAPVSWSLYKQPLNNSFQTEHQYGLSSATDDVLKPPPQTIG
jgi:hypothetical protein